MGERDPERRFAAGRRKESEEETGAAFRLVQTPPVSLLETPRPRSSFGLLLGHLLFRIPYCSPFDVHQQQVPQNAAPRQHPPDRPQTVQPTYVQRLPGGTPAGNPGDHRGHVYSRLRGANPAGRLRPIRLRPEDERQVGEDIGACKQQ